MLAGNASRESPQGWSGGRDATAGLLGDRTVLVLKEGLGWTGLGGGLSKPGDSHAHQEGEPSQECSPSRPTPADLAGRAVHDWTEVLVTLGAKEWV